MITGTTNFTANNMQSIQRIQTSRVPMLALETVLIRTPYCTVREQAEQHLIYNTKTDEMYLVPNLGVYLYELCDGVATIGDIENVFFHVLNGDRSVLRTQLMGFFEKLVERGILKTENHPS